MHCWRSGMLCLLLCVTASSQAWWGGVPYPPGYQGPGQWPNAWPVYGPYGQNRGYGGSDWNVKGYINEWGDTHFIIEYHGNIYHDMNGGAYGYPGYGRHGLPFRGYPYYGGWR